MPWELLAQLATRPTRLGAPRRAPWGSYVLHTRPGWLELVPTQQRGWCHLCQPKLAVMVYLTCSMRFGAPKWAAWDCYVLLERPVLFRHGRVHSATCGIGPWPVGPCGPLGGLVTARGRVQAHHSVWSLVYTVWARHTSVGCVGPRLRLCRSRASM